MHRSEKRSLNLHKILRGLPAPKWDPWDQRVLRESLQVPRMGWSGRGLLVCSCLGSAGTCALTVPWLSDHVTREKLDRILALIQGSHQKALVM